MGPRVLLLVALLALPTFAPPAAACSVPCGRIYPIILLSLAEGTPTVVPAQQGTPLLVDAELTYRFDAVNDGYSVTSPTDQPVVGFEFPRKPSWVEIKVEPDRIEVPVDNPTFITPDPTANPPSATFSFTAKFKIHILVTDQAILRDGYDYAKLLVFARSTETGLYQAAYGIKEVRIAPAGALHESDVAGARDVFSASPLPALDLPIVETSVAGTKATFTPPAQPRFWESGAWNVQLAPVPAGRVVLAVHDEAGNIVALDGPREAAGSMPFNVTLTKPGLHAISATLLPSPGTTTPPATLVATLRAGDLAAEGFAYPKSYIVSQTGVVPAPTGNTVDATMQWERVIPFYAFDTAQAVSVLVTLLTPGDPGPLARGLANIEFSIIDPDGNALTSLSVDPSNPSRPDRIGSIPIEGWYALRLRGSGLPVAAAYDARIEVNYAVAPQARNRADGAPDMTSEVSRHAGQNVTLPGGNASVWASSDLTPTFDKLPNVQYQTTVTDANEALAYASGLRTGKSAFTAPAPGLYRAFVYAEPGVGAPFAPTVRAFTFRVGDGDSVVAQKFPIEDAPSVPTSAMDTVVAIYALPYLDAAAKGAGTMAGGRLETMDDAGKAGTPATPGTYYLRAIASNAGPAASMPVKYALDMPAPVTIHPEGDAAATSGTSGFPVPAPAIGLVLAVTGLAAVAIALARRR